MVAAGGCCIVEAGGRTVVEAVISGAGRVTSRAVTWLPGARAAVSGAGAAVAPFGAESLHPTREFPVALQERGVFGRSDNSREFWQGYGYDDAVCTVGRGI
jgi:hypothetical protein